MTDVPNRTSDIDPKNVWQNQPSELSAMTLMMIRQKVQELQAKTRRMLVGNIAAVLIVVASAWFGFLHTDSLVYRSAFVISVLWAVAGQFFLQRGLWSSASPAQWALVPGVEFYRREIDRRLSVQGRLLQWSLGPMILNLALLGLLLTGMARTMSKPGAALPFTTLCAVWLVAAIALRSKQQRQLKAEREELLDRMGMR
jgi:hypothetical protein